MKTMWTAEDYRRAREGTSDKVTVVEWEGFFPAPRPAPAFENCCANGRCHKCK